jgi:DNA-binding CsgD family transcriptional regulator
MLLFDQEERLLFANDEAQQILPDLFAAPPDGSEQSSGVLNNLSQLLDELRDSAGCLLLTGDTPCMVLEDGERTPYAFRAFPYSHNGPGQVATHVMVLVERIVTKREPDFDMIKTTYGLSRREMDVLRHLYQGKANKAISDSLFISEFTVKDHLKKIMQKMNARSRSELLSLL